MEGKPQGSHGSGHGVWGGILGKGQRRSRDGAERDPKSRGVTMGSCPVSLPSEDKPLEGAAWLGSKAPTSPSPAARPSLVPRDLSAGALRKPVLYSMSVRSLSGSILSWILWSGSDTDAPLRPSEAPAAPAAAMRDGTGKCWGLAWPGIQAGAGTWRHKDAAWECWQIPGISARRRAGAGGSLRSWNPGASSWAWPGQPPPAPQK